jgi:hypothetical protein
MLVNKFKPDIYYSQNIRMFSDTQKYVVTFTSSQSYIEVPGWRKGDISFSFRTTGEKAILLYQPPIRPNHPSFMVALTNGMLRWRMGRRVSE